MKRHVDTADQRRLRLVLVARAVNLRYRRCVGQIGASEYGDEAVQNPLAEVLTEKVPQPLTGSERGVAVHAFAEPVEPAQIDGGRQRQGPEVAGLNAVGLLCQRRTMRLPLGLRRRSGTEAAVAVS